MIQTNRLRRSDQRGGGVRGRTKVKPKISPPRAAGNRSTSSTTRPYFIRPRACQPHHRSNHDVRRTRTLQLLWTSSPSSQCKKHSVSGKSSNCHITQSFNFFSTFRVSFCMCARRKTSVTLDDLHHHLAPWPYPIDGVRRNSILSPTGDFS